MDLPPKHRQGILQHMAKKNFENKQSPQKQGEKEVGGTSIPDVPQVQYTTKQSIIQKMNKDRTSDMETLEKMTSEPKDKTTDKTSVTPSKVVIINNQKMKIGLGQSRLQKIEILKRTQGEKPTTTSKTSDTVVPNTPEEIQGKKNNSQTIKDVVDKRKTRSKKSELAAQGSEKQQKNVPKEKKKDSETILKAVKHPVAAVIAKEKGRLLGEYMSEKNITTKHSPKDFGRRQLKMPWRCPANYNDCGVYAIRHMETYKGEGDDWESGFQKDKDATFLRELRARYAASVILMDINEIKTEVLDKANKFTTVLKND